MQERNQRCHALRIRPVQDACYSDIGAWSPAEDCHACVHPQDWKLERITRDNKALEMQNSELRNQLLEIKQENLEVSEKIVVLDEETRTLKLKVGLLQGWPKLKQHQAPPRHRRRLCGSGRVRRCSRECLKCH